MTQVETNHLVYSSLADDPDIGELVEMFVEELPARLDALQKALASHDLESLGRFAHQLKGAAGSYGFGELTRPLALLEHRVRDNATEEYLLHSVQEVLAVCQRVRAGVPPVEENS